MACERKAKYTTRKARRNVASVNCACAIMRNMLELFVVGDNAGCIKLLNSVQPLDVAEYIMGRSVTVAEGNLYLLAIADMPRGMQDVYRTAKIFQDMKQACRKFMQGTSCDSKEDITKKMANFITTMESSKR